MPRPWRTRSGRGAGAPQVRRPPIGLRAAGEGAVAITRQLAELNAPQLPELEADVRKGSLEQLRASLKAQARIIREAE